MARDEEEIRREPLPLEHEHSDPEYKVFLADGRSYQTMNLLGCSTPGCKASFSNSRKRAWHIQTAHPGEYSGPSEDMMFLSDLMKDRYGKDASIGRTYGNLRGKQAWEIDEMKDDE